MPLTRSGNYTFGREFSIYPLSLCTEIDRRVGKISALTTTVWPSASRPA